MRAFGFQGEVANKFLEAGDRQVRRPWAISTGDVDDRFSGVNPWVLWLAGRDLRVRTFRTILSFYRDVK